jgi:hypothetical protein
MFREYWSLWPFDRSVEIIIVTVIVAVVLPLWFHIFMYWTTRRRKFVGKEFYQEVNVWLGEMRRKYAIDKPQPKNRKKSPTKEP